MPISVQVPPLGKIGPGWSLQVHTDLPGPFDPAIDLWTLTVISSGVEASGANALLTAPCTGQTQILDLSDLQLSTNVPAFITSEPCLVRLTLTEIGVGNLDTPYQQDGWSWDELSSLYRLVQNQIQQNGGLTQAEVVQLDQTHNATAVAQLTDALTLTEVTSGPSPGPLVVPLGFTTFGVIVRLATVPAALEPQTPDGQYWVKTLATVRVFRGDDLWFRVPIHTPSKIVPFSHEGLTVWVASAELNNWILNIRVLVDFLPGVTGQVFLMHFP